MGLTNVEFRCPKCAGTEWQTESALGACRACGYTWSRRHDFRVFVRVDTGKGFATHAELEAELAGPDAHSRILIPRPVTFAETLHDLLAELMAQHYQRDFTDPLLVEIIGPEAAGKAQALMQNEQVRDFYKQNGKTPRQLLRERVPVKDRAEFDRRFPQ